MLKNLQKIVNDIVELLTEKLHDDLGDHIFRLPSVIFTFLLTLLHLRSLGHYLSSNCPGLPYFIQTFLKLFLITVPYKGSVKFLADFQKSEIFSPFNLIQYVTIIEKRILPHKCCFCHFFVHMLPLCHLGVNICFSANLLFHASFLYIF